MLRLGRGLDVPLVQWALQGAGDLSRQLRLAGSGLTLDEDGPGDRDGGIERHHEVIRNDVAIRTAEAGSGHDSSPRNCNGAPAQLFFILV